MAVDMEQVRAAIDRADEEAIVRLFKGVSENDRRAVAGEIRGVYLKLPHHIQDAPDHWKVNPSMWTAELAIVATSSPSDVWRTVEFLRSDEFAVKVVTGRPNSWIARLIEQTLGEDDRCPWYLLVELMRRGHGDPSPVTSSFFG